MTRSYLHRQFSRIPFERYVSLDFVNDLHEFCQVRDVSLTGISVFGSFQQQPGDTCFITLEQAGLETDSRLKASARIVWKNDYGIGLEFQSMSLESYIFLQTTLLYEAADPLAMGLELPEVSPYDIVEGVLVIPDTYCSPQLLAV